MIDNALIPNRGGVWIDVYNQSIMEDKAGTITTKVSCSGNHYVTDIQPINALRGGVSPCITSHYNKAGVIHTSSGSGGNTDQYVLEKRYRIRKLTEREVFRLMDVDDADIDKILDAKIEVRGKEKRAISKSACYRLAGNSICVGVMFHIFRTLFIDNQPENEYKPKQLELF